MASRTSPVTSTVRGYTAHVRLYLRSHLGPILLSELTVGHVQAMFNAITRQHEVEGRPVTPAMLARIRATLRVVLKAAVRQGYVADNPSHQG